MKRVKHAAGIMRPLPTVGERIEDALGLLVPIITLFLIGVGFALAEEHDSHAPTPGNPASEAELQRRTASRSADPDRAEHVTRSTERARGDASAEFIALRGERSPGGPAPVTDPSIGSEQANLSGGVESRHAATQAVDNRKGDTCGESATGLALPVDVQPAAAVTRGEKIEGLRAPITNPPSNKRPAAAATDDGQHSNERPNH